MNIDIVCIGKLKESYWVDAIKEYSKRLSRFCNLNIIELKEYKASDDPKEKEIEEIKFEEGKTILSKIKDDTYVITLEILGKQLDSVELSNKIEDLKNMGKSNLAFVIGGSFGLSKEVSERSNFKLSFSRMTFPHQMMRVILLEQIYRAFKISHNESYHK